MRGKVEFDTATNDAADEREEVQQARERLQQPFSEAELEDRVRRLKPGKSVLGALKPAMLKRALPYLAAPLLAAPLLAERVRTRRTTAEDMDSECASAHS